MQSWILRLFIGAVSLLLQGMLGCDNTSLLTSQAGIAYQMTVSPAGLVQLGFLEDQEFEIHLIDLDNNPVAGETVEISLIGSAHNAQISLDTVDTNSNGAATTTVTAPDKQSEFTVRFVTRRLGQSVSVNVEVLSHLLDLNIEIEKKSSRVAGKFEATLFENLTCPDLVDTNDEQNFTRETVEDVPGNIRFTGLRAHQNYAVLVEGFNEYGQIRLSGCKDGLEPGEPDVVLVLLDTLLDIAGKYAVVTEIKPNGALDEPVHELFDTLYGSPIFKNTEKAILDKVRALLLEEDSFAGEAFDEIRQKRDLDNLLAADLSVNDVDVLSNLNDIKTEMFTYLQRGLLESELDIATPEGDVWAISHRLLRLVFTNGTDVIALRDHLFAETMTGEARFQKNNQDTLLLGYHTLNFGLAVALHQIFRHTLLSKFESETLSSALVSLVNCERTADTLLSSLEEVTNRAVIFNGCVEATNDAEALLSGAIDLMNFYYKPLSIQGMCLIHDPGDSNHIDGFAGLFALQWANLKSDPIECPFLGSLVF